MTSIKMEELKRKFNNKLCELMSNKAYNSGYLSKEKYLQQINEIKKLKRKESKKTPQDYQKLKRFDLIKIGDSEKLIYPVSDNSVLKYYVADEEIFDIIHEVHLSIGHGGRNRMIQEIKKKYKNITKETIMLYLNLCEICQKKFKVPKKDLVVKPMIFNEVNSCQVDLIDMQSQEDRGFKFILVYQDHLTKFVQLRPLRTKTAEEVANTILDIFTIFGAPCVLQSDNGREFSNRVIEEICSMWSELKIVYGKPRHSQSQGSVERANQDVENILSTWLQTHETHWSDGLRFVQFMKNRAYHKGMKCSPYEAMFGQSVKVGLETSNLPGEALQSLRSEEDLQELLCLNVSGNNKDEEDVNETQGEENHSSDQEDKDNEQDEEDGDGNETQSEENNHHLEELENVRKIGEKRVKIRDTQEKVKHNLQVQAKKMKMMSSAKFPEPNVGETVRLRIPDVDRGRSDPKNLLAVILSKKDDFYELGTKHGVLLRLYARNEFSICTESFINPEEVPAEKIGIRECARKSSQFEGQGFKRCNCKENARLISVAASVRRSCVIQNVIVAYLV